MSSTARNGSSLKLSETPPPVRSGDVSNWQANMRRAFMNAATPETTIRVVNALVKRAEAGDFAAAKLYLSYAVGSPCGSADLVSPDEPAACETLPGTNAKLDVLSSRVRRGESLHSKDDPRPNLD